MKILLTGSEDRLDALQDHAIMSLKPEVVLGGSDDYAKIVFENHLSDYEAVIDLNLDENVEAMDAYAFLKDKIVLGCAVKMTLSGMAFESLAEPECHFFGLNALPGFLDLPEWEVSSFREEERPVLTEFLARAGIGTNFVADSPGMTAPRVLAMIINEAWFMRQEKTADTEAIDDALKAGVNYPYGPFEWCDRIGLQNVYDVLIALAAEFGDTYKIAPELRRQWQLSWLT